MEVPLLALKHNAPEIGDKLTRIQALIDGGWQREVVALMEDARKTVSKLTPRSVSAGGMLVGRGKRKQQAHLADGWTLRTIGRGGKDRVPVLTVVHNRFTHDAAGRMKDAAVVGERFGRRFTLTEILEYGTMPHPITPRRASVLHFFTRRGAEVYTAHVSHPGTKAYAMVRLTRVLLHKWAAALQRRWKKKVDREWRK